VLDLEMSVSLQIFDNLSMSDYQKVFIIILSITNQCNG